MARKNSVNTWVVAAVAVVGTLLALPGVSDAASIAGPRRSALERLEEGDAIRNRLMLRGGRFEVAPQLGFTLNDAFRRNILFGAQLNYHLSDSMALGITAMGGLAFDSALAERIADERPDRTKSGAFSDVKLLTSAEFIYTPLVGKFAVVGRYVFGYDFHAIVGLGASLVGGGEQLDDFAFAPVAGLGMRVFFDDWMAVTFQVRDYIYSSALNAVPSAEGTGDTSTESGWSNNFAVNFGVGFYFPRVPKLSK